MADFKDVIIRLQENRNSNVEAIETQTSALSETIVSTAKTQNRSFGQSLALQFKRNTGELSELKSIFLKLFSSPEKEFDSTLLVAVDKSHGVGKSNCLTFP